MDYSKVVLNPKWSFNELALAFARAAANGNAYYAVVLIRVLKLEPVDTPLELQQVITEIQNRRRECCLLTFDFIPDKSSLNFVWNCKPSRKTEPRPRGKGLKISETRILLDSAAKCVRITGGSKEAVKRRAKAALGKPTIEPWQAEEE